METVPPHPEPWQGRRNRPYAVVKLRFIGRTIGEMTQAMADVYGRYSGSPEW
ncbi:MAG: hypothetical protein ACF8R9_06765 [Phycisphaerales bacterium JB054]